MELFPETGVFALDCGGWSMRHWRDEMAERWPHAREICARVRDFDWAATSVGPAEDWPESLKLILSMMLDSGFPMSVRWGPDLIMFYNDAYAPLLGDRHPRLGQAASRGLA